MNLVQSIIMTALIIAWLVLIRLIGQLMESVERYLKSCMKRKTNVKRSAKAARKGDRNVTSNLTHTV